MQCVLIFYKPSIKFQWKNRSIFHFNSERRNRNKVVHVYWNLGCTDETCSIRLYNVDEYSYAFINQYTVAYQQSSTDSGFIDVTSFLRSGSNDFTFLTYNNAYPSSWGFQIKKNGGIIFENTGGLLKTISANNNSNSTVNQFVYNRTVSVNVTKCSTTTTTLSTGTLVLEGMWSEIFLVSK